MAFCVVLIACGARSSLDAESVGDASSDASIAISGHPDEVGLAVGVDWICVYRPGGKSGCSGEIGSSDATAIKLPQHMWNMRGTFPYGDPVCGMTPNGLSCWGEKQLLPSGCEEVPTLAPYIHSKSCQPTILADTDFAQVAPPEFVSTSGALLGFAGSGALAAQPQPRPLRAIARYASAAGIDFDGNVVTWDVACKSDCTSTIIDTGLVAVGIVSNAFGVCVWDVAGRLSCWGDATMMGGTTPHIMAMPPVRDVVARNVSMCALGKDGSVTCFGCTKTAACAGGDWWADYYLSPLTTSPQTISFPRPAVALASTSRICAVLDDSSVWCVGAFPGAADAGLTDTPTHVTALDP